MAGVREGSKRHHQTIRILYDLCKKDIPKYYSKVYADHIGEEYKSINILSSHGRGTADVVYPYNPDLWCKLAKEARVDVIEVWDGQSEESSVKDVLLGGLTPNIDTFSIVCFDEETEKLAWKLSKVVLGSLYDENGDLLLPPDRDHVFVVRLPPKAEHNESRITRLLSRGLNLDRNGGLNVEKPKSGWESLKQTYPTSAAVEARLRDPAITPNYRKVLRSLKNYWLKRRN